MIIWLCSYPKSGNTYIRAFLSAYYFTNDGIFDFELLKFIEQFPDKQFYKKFIKTKDEAAKQWLPLQKEFIKSGKIKFLKTHSAYGSYDKNPFTTPETTLGGIYIVRDPRNVVSSLMNHFSINEGDALKMMNNVHRNLRDRNDKDNYATYSFISSWDKNYKSWKLTKNINKILIKYEDLEKDIENTFLKIIKFTNKIMRKNDEINFEKLRKSIKTTEFDLLKKKEEKEGFDEAIYSSDNSKTKAFFNLGRNNDYKKLLNNKTIKSIEESFGEEMKELGYL
mgnify:CR=1 FL=1